MTGFLRAPRFFGRAAGEESEKAVGTLVLLQGAEHLLQCELAGCKRWLQFLQLPFDAPDESKSQNTVTLGSFGSLWQKWLTPLAEREWIRKPSHDSKVEVSPYLGSVGGTGGAGFLLKGLC